MFARVVGDADPYEYDVFILLKCSRGICALHFAFSGCTECPPTGWWRESFISAGGDLLIRHGKAAPPSPLGKATVR